MKKIVQAIVEIQREDGGFRPFWLKESDPLYAGLVLQIFMWVGVMKKKNVGSMIEGVALGSSG